MSLIRSKDTKPERIIRGLIHKRGYRFQLHRKDLPGKPDLVFPRFKSVVFVHGCFWHLCGKCQDGRIPKTRTGYWKEKLENNKRRDSKRINELRELDWHVMRIWECDVEKRTEKTINRICAFLKNN